MSESANLSRERLNLRVQSISYTAKDTYLVELTNPEGPPLSAVAPGAHIDLHLDNGISRSYSLVRSGDNPESYVVGVKLDAKSRGGSRYVHEQLRVGSLLEVSAPRNLFPLHEDAAHTVLIAGGIGITPIWCMAQRLQAIGASWELRYSVRSRADLAFASELHAMGSRVHLHIDEEAGSIMNLPSIFAAAPAHTHFYCCGPTPMLDAYEAAAAQFPQEQVHLERFAAKQAASVDGGFVISLARSCRDLVVPQGTSVLKVLLDNGIEVESSCQEGICGCCEVVVLEGDVDHRDAILTESERASNKTMMVCCSGAKSSRLVLDL